jgi:hypothetical protein
VTKLPTPQKLEDPPIAYEDGNLSTREIDLIIYRARKYQMKKEKNMQRATVIEEENQNS